MLEHSAKPRASKSERHFRIKFENQRFLRDRVKETLNVVRSMKTFDFDEEFVEQEIEDTPLEILDGTINQKIF